MVEKWREKSWVCGFVFVFCSASSFCIYPSAALPPLSKQNTGVRTLFRFTHTLTQAHTHLLSHTNLNPASFALSSSAAARP